MWEVGEKGNMNPTDLCGRLPESRTIWSPFVIPGREDGGESDSQEYLGSTGDGAKEVCEGRGRGPPVTRKPAALTLCLPTTSDRQGYTPPKSLRIHVKSTFSSFWKCVLRKVKP